MMGVPRRKTKDVAALSLRPMSSSDISAALSILEESPEAARWSRASLVDSASSGFAWVAELDGRVSGILVGRVAADEFEILNLAVAKVCRRKGVATRLVTSALESARTAGAPRIYLEVRASNEGAIDLYTRMGFRESGRRRNYYRNPSEDAVLLVLNQDGRSQ
jgi:[ribosomal protein S18]-alanine N-acetyltransferase